VNGCLLKILRRDPTHSSVVLGESGEAQAYRQHTREVQRAIGVFTIIIGFMKTVL
jgi:hypothetical protein